MRRQIRSARATDVELVGTLTVLDRLLRREAGTRSVPRQSQAVGILLFEYSDRHPEDTFILCTPVSGAEKYLL